MAAAATFLFFSDLIELDFESIEQSGTVKVQQQQSSMEQAKATTAITSEMAKQTQTTASPPHPYAGRIIFVTGRQGAGKNAVANGLASKHGLVHLDGDHWSCRPEVRELRAAVSSYMMIYRNGNENSKLDELESDAWQPFYKAMCEEAINMNNASNTGVLVSHSLYRKSHRAFVKECLGQAGLFLVLTPPPVLVLQRAAMRCAEQYSTMGKTVKEWEEMLAMNSVGFQEYDPKSEKEVEALVLKNDGTEQTVAELVTSAEKLLGL